MLCLLVLTMEMEVETIRSLFFSYSFLLFSSNLSVLQLLYARSHCKHKKTDVYFDCRNLIKGRGVNSHIFTVWAKDQTFLCLIGRPFVCVKAHLVGQLENGRPYSLVLACCCDSSQCE